MNLKQKQIVHPSGSKRFQFSILQHRITQATYKNQPRKIRNLQRLLIKSLSTRIQTMLIASQIKKITNKYSLFLDTEKRKPNNFLMKQKKYLYIKNTAFVKKFSLIFYRKFFYYFLFFFSKKIKEKQKKIMNEKSSNKRRLEILSSPHELSNSQEGIISLNPLFLFVYNLAFSPVIETLLQEKKEKKCRNSSELILFLKNFSNSSIELIQNPNLFRVFFLNDKKKKFSKKEAYLNPWVLEKQKAIESQLSQKLDLETNKIDKPKLISTWILKLEIHGFYDHSNNSWLYKNFPIESMILKQLLKFMLNLYFFFEKKINSNNKKSLPFRGRQYIKNGFLSYLNVRVNKILRDKSQLFHEDFFHIWNNLSSKKSFFDNFCTNFDNFFSFCLIGLENYLKEIFYIFNDFYFSEWHEQFYFEKEWTQNSKKSKHVFYFPRFIHLTGLTPRQFKKTKKFLNFFLKQRGLYLKNFICFNFKKGLDILGWHVKIKEKDLLVKVSESFCNFQKKEIKWLIKNSNKEPLYKIIVKLNNKIKNDLIEYENQKFYNILNFKNIETFYDDLNFFINQTFWKWAKKKHNNHSNIWVFQKYWGLRKNPNFSRTKNFLFLSYSLKKKRNKKIQKEIITNKRRIFVLLYSNESWKKFYDYFLSQTKTKIKHPDKKDEIFAQDKITLFKGCEVNHRVRKNHFHLEYNIFSKYKDNLYFLNYYSLDFQTQYFFYIFSFP